MNEEERKSQCSRYCIRGTVVSMEDLKARMQAFADYYIQTMVEPFKWN